MVAVVLLALLPSAWLAYNWRAMPHLGFYHDDSIYWVLAEGIAHGDGYRIISLPGQPYQTKYPPLYPALLAAIWMANPNFPSNVPVAMAVSWALLPLFIVMVWLFLRQYGFTPPERAGLCAIAALNPIAVMFSVSLMAELLFTILFMASLLLAERAEGKNSAVWLSAAAGALAGLAFLARSSALPLLATAPICFIAKKQYRRALAFFFAMLPFVAGWEHWVWAHLSNSRDVVTLYYTNYLGLQVNYVSLSDVPRVVWRNLNTLLVGIGQLMTFDFGRSSELLERVVAVVAIAGSIRLAKRADKVQFLTAATGFCLLLLVWHYAPDLRFVFPLYPFLAAGLWTEIKNVLKAVQLAWANGRVMDRAVGAVFALVLGAFGLFIAYTAVLGHVVFLPGKFEWHQEQLIDKLPAYTWIAKNTPPNANVLAYDDPLLFLYTGRRSCGFPIPPQLVYRDDFAGQDRLLSSIPDFARYNRLDFLLLTRHDFYRDLNERGVNSMTRAVESSGEFQREFQSPTTTIYRLTK